MAQTRYTPGLEKRILRPKGGTTEYSVSSESSLAIRMFACASLSVGAGGRGNQHVRPPRSDEGIAIHGARVLVARRSTHSFTRTSLRSAEKVSATRKFGPITYTVRGGDGSHAVIATTAAKLANTEITFNDSRDERTDCRR